MANPHWEPWTGISMLYALDSGPGSALLPAYWVTLSWKLYFLGVDIFFVK